jgi:hypothetical protein
LLTSSLEGGNGITYFTQIGIPSLHMHFYTSFGGPPPPPPRDCFWSFCDITSVVRTFVLCIPFYTGRTDELSAWSEHTSNTKRRDTINNDVMR